MQPTPAAVANQALALRVHGNLGHVIMRQPARALAVLPLLPIKSNHPEVRGEPNLARRDRRPCP